MNVVLHCPRCHVQHIDRPETDEEYASRLHESSWWELGGEQPARWTNPPHRSHLCAACGCLWRPADEPTNGVATAQTRGAKDTWPPVGPVTELEENMRVRPKWVSDFEGWSSQRYRK